MQPLSESKTKKPRPEYGKQARDVQQDVFTEGLNKLINMFKEEKKDIKNVRNRGKHKRTIKSKTMESKERKKTDITFFLLYIYWEGVV